MASNPVVQALINSYMPRPGDEDLMPPAAGYQNPERDINSILSIAGARLNDRLSDVGVSIAQALMAPGNAAMGQYDQRPVYADGSVGMFDPRMEMDAANLAGLVSLGAAPIPRPAGSLNMGASVRPNAEALRKRPVELDAPSDTIGVSGLVRDGYVGSHKAPPLEKGATLNDPRMVFGDDIFSPQAQQYFGTGNKVMDAESIAVIKSAMDNPDALVSIYRAVPKDVPNSINPGDWVTISRSYANDHGVSSLGGDFNIIETKVPARQLSTDGNSIHEWGWWP